MSLAWLVWVGAALAEEPPAHEPGVTCADCHEDPHAGTAARGCEACHDTAAWTAIAFTAADHAAAALPLDGAHAAAACAACHTDGRFLGQPTTCDGCHVDRHRGLLGEDCTACHTVEAFLPVDGFDHARSGFSLAAAHAPLECAACHRDAPGQALREGRGPGCETCHDPAHGELGACATCHLDAHLGFDAARARDVFDHRATGFHLERRHGALACASCHPDDGGPPEARCASCHVDPHAGQLSFQCEDCHRPDRWRLTRFDHDLSGWALRGRHHVAPCASCHTGQRWIGTPTECWDCHAGDAARALSSSDVPAHAFGRVDCGDCHGQWRW